MADSNSVEGNQNSSKVEDSKNDSSHLIDISIALDSELENMVAESLKDVSSDEDLESDEELMRELKEITDGPTEKPNLGIQGEHRILSTSDQISLEVIKQRIDMYKLAEGKAKVAGESAKVRRLERGLSRLNNLLQQTNEGVHIKSDDIPPEVTSKCAEENGVTSADKSSLL